MKKPVVAGILVFVLLVGSYVLLFGRGKVFQDESASNWDIAKAVVQTRVFRSPMVTLGHDPDPRYVTRGDVGRERYLALMKERGLTFKDEVEGELLFLNAQSQDCYSYVMPFTRALKTYDTPVCEEAVGDGGEEGEPVEEEEEEGLELEEPPADSP